MAFQQDMSQEQAQVYDRQGFIGNKVQKSLLASKVLIVGLNGSNTELAKNLILSGANLHIVDDQVINEIDVDTNFLFSKVDMGQMVGFIFQQIQRGQLGAQKLKEINPLVKIEVVPVFDLNNNIKNDDNDDQFNLRQYNIVATSTKDFGLMEVWANLCHKANVPFYNLVCCGLYGFIYISLGTGYKYQKEKQIIRQISFSKVAQQSKEPEYREFEQVTAQCVTFKEALKEDHNNQSMSTNDIYYCILMMSKVYQVEELKRYDPYDLSPENQSKLEQMVLIGEQVYEKALGRKPKVEVLDLMRNFARLYGVEFCPTYSILGSVASQEFIMTISHVNEPAINWFCYDSQAGYGLTEAIQDIRAFPRIDLPLERQLKVVDS